MTKFVEALAGKIADRWMTMLVIPGVVYLAAIFIAVRLGHARWWDLASLRTELTATRTSGTVILILVLVLAGASAAGVAVQALGALFVRIWLMPPHDPLARWLTSRRAAAWEHANSAFRSALVAAGRAQLTDEPDALPLRRAAEQLAARRNRISLAAPQRPFWLGDRIAATDTRVYEKYRLDLSAAWPRLWLVMPEAVRTEFGLARTALTRASCLAAWAVAYAVLGGWWWPALLIGAACGATAWARARSSCDVLADLVEAAVDVHGRALAESLGLPSPGVLTRETGSAITETLRKDT